MREEIFVEEILAEDICGIYFCDLPCSVKMKIDAISYVKPYNILKKI